MIAIDASMAFAWMLGEEGSQDEGEDETGMDEATVTAAELKAYAAGELGWASLRARGVRYEQVLAGLGELGLRQPVAPMSGPNLEARRRGVRLLRALLAAARP